VYTNVQFVQLPLVLCCSRFILNIPEEEFKSSDRLFFQIEQAHWFYLDFYRERNPQLPNLTLQKFGEKSMRCVLLCTVPTWSPVIMPCFPRPRAVFMHVPFLVPHLKDYDVSFDQWRQYKLKVPVYGAIMLNRAMDKVRAAPSLPPDIPLPMPMPMPIFLRCAVQVVLVKGWTQRSSWGFPKGKVNQNEKGIDCAVREVSFRAGGNGGHRDRPCRDEKHRELQIVCLACFSRHRLQYAQRVGS
jgi:hypothetical protein